MCLGDTQYIVVIERQLVVMIKVHTTSTNSTIFKQIENCDYFKNYNKTLADLNSLNLVSHIVT